MNPKFSIVTLLAILVVCFIYITSLMYSQLMFAEKQDVLLRQNNTYHRTTTCILSVPLATRTPEYISECYNKAEKANDIKVDRFGNR